MGPVTRDTARHRPAASKATWGSETTAAFTPPRPRPGFKAYCKVTVIENDSWSLDLDKVTKAIQWRNRKSTSVSENNWMSIRGGKKQNKTHFNPHTIHKIFT